MSNFVGTTAKSSPAKSAAAPTAASFLESDQVFPFGVLAGLTLLLILGFGNTLKDDLADYWTDPQYSHGYLVPLFPLVWFYLRWQPIGAVPLMERWIGVGVLAGSLVMRLVGSYLGIPYLDMISFLPALAGVFLLVGGFNIMKWAGPGLAFLIFMYPLPGPATRALLVPLNKIATVASTFCIQTLGIPAYRTGNSISLLNLDNPLNVVDACSGLRMATIFVALSVAVAMLIERPIWMRLVIVASALPIAIVTNVIRIVITAVLYNTGVSEEIAKTFFHDGAGYMMPIIALGFLFLEMQILDNLFIQVEVAKPKVGVASLAPAMKLKAR